jgi:hypothetical protein
VSDQKLPIDISFNFYSDSDGKDPDSYSPTLKKYHKLLWSKPLPNGKIFTLTDTDSSSYLTYSSAQEVISLSSDSISNSYRDKKALASITSELSKEVEEFRNIGSTIGGYILFPGKRIDEKMTINGARGFNAKIADRFDLTLECIRLHYTGAQNPLQEVLTQNSSFFKLFESFAGYVDFFLLQDLVSQNYESINFFTPIKQIFESSPLPATQAEYLQYMYGSTSFTTKRSVRIKKWAVNTEVLPIINLK